MYLQPCLPKHSERAFQALVMQQLAIGKLDGWEGGLCGLVTSTVRRALPVCYRAGSDCYIYFVAADFQPATIPLSLCRERHSCTAGFVLLKMLYRAYIYTQPKLSRNCGIKHGVLPKDFGSLPIICSMPLESFAAAWEGMTILINSLV